MTTFAVLAHDDPALLARLCARLAPHPVVIHVDARRPLAPFRRALAAAPHARLIDSGRVVVNWGGWSQVEATLRLYRSIIAAPDASATGDEEQIVLLSGHCYPLRPVGHIIAALAANPRPLHLRGVRYADLRDRDRTRVRHFYDAFPVRQQGWRRWAYAAPRKAAQLAAPLFPRAIEGEHDLLVGSQWSVLTIGVVREVVLPAAELWRTRLRHTFAPEETFFPTVVLGARAAQTQDGGPSPFAGERTADYPNIHLLDPSMTKIYTLNDLEQLTASPMLFVRKVESGRSSALLDALDGRAAAGA